MPTDLSSAGISKTAALSAIGAIAERWRIPKTERYLLLGVPQNTANHWFSNLSRGEIDERETLRAPILERVSHVLSIYDVLHRLIKGPEADEWLERPNRAFGGQQPRELLLSGRSDDLLRVRWYLELVASQ